MSKVRYWADRIERGDCQVRVIVVGESIVRTRRRRLWMFLRSRWFRLVKGKPKPMMWKGDDGAPGAPA